MTLQLIEHYSLDDERREESIRAKHYDVIVIGAG